MEITSLGAGSGLDLASLVDQLVGAERQSRETRLVTNEARAISQLSAFGQVTGAVSAFQDSLEPLEDLENYRGRTAFVAEDAPFTATANADAATGRFSVEVVSLAQAQKIRTDAFESSTDNIGSGTITIATSEGSFAVSIEDGAGSLVDIRDAINSSSENSFITAGIVNSVDGAHLVLTGNESGEAAAFTVSVSEGDGGLAGLAFAGDDSASSFSIVEGAADAQLLVDGLEVRSATNRVADAIDGVTIDILDAQEGTAFELTVGFDRESARSQIESFVEGYNNLLLTVNNQVTFNAETFQSGPLFGDSAVRSLISDAREVVNSVAEGGTSSLGSLAQIGITTEVDGTLTIDEETLSEALSTNFEDVGLLFAGEDGAAARLGDLLGGYIEPTGRLSTRTDSLESRIDDFASQRESLNRRLESFETRVRRQFTALDSLLSELNNTSTFLAQQLDSLPGSGS